MKERQADLDASADENQVLFGFERLDVWRRAVDLAGVVYSVCRGLPREEQFGLSLQMRRAAVSVAANIAEGASRSSGRDQARFFEIAYGSLNELATLLTIAASQGWMEDDRSGDLRREISEIGRMVGAAPESIREGLPAIVVVAVW